MPWKAIYTKPRHEKKVSERLTQKGIEVYCPLQTTVKQWSDRKKKVKEPIFKSYVFVNCDEQEQLAVLQTAGVVQFVYYLKRVAIIRNEEIDQIKRFIEGYENIVLENIDKWKIGDEVRIDEGGMKGLLGEIIDIREKKARLLLNEMGIGLVADIPLSRLTI